MTLPVLFIGHGSPLNAISNNPFTDQWRKLGERIQPEVILMISAHWFVSNTYIQNDPKARFINDTIIDGSLSMTSYIFK